MTDRISPNLTVERCLSLLLDSSADPIVCTDAQGVVRLWSRAAERFFGYSGDQVVGRSIDMLIPPELGEETSAHVERVRASGEAESIETVRLTSQDVRVRVRVSLGVADDGTGIWVFHDLTQQDRANERYHRLVSNLPDIIFRYQLWPEVRAEYLSPAVETVSGYRPEDFYEDPSLHERLVHPEDWGLLHVPAAGGAAAPPQTQTLRWIAKGGETRWMEQRSTLIRDDQARVVAVEGVARDVTARVAADQERDDLRFQLAESQKMEALGRLAGGIAHDFNNLLAVILSSASFLAEDLPSDDPLREDVEEILGAARRSSVLTRQLLASSRHEAKPPAPLSLASTLRELHRMLSRVLGDPFELLMDIRETAPILACETQVEQLLLNLVVNARDAMPAGGRIWISLDEVPAAGGGLRSVRLCVSDEGEGMTAEVAERAFEPLFTTKARGRGTGLGLSTVYGFVRASGGTVALDTSPGRGASFTFQFPALLDESVVTGSLSSLPGEAAGPDAVRVLVVEDDDAVRSVAVRALSRAGLAVVSTSDAEEAIRIVESGDEHFDLLLTDVIMPGASGPALAAQLREGQPGLRVLFMSGYTAEHLRGVPLENSAPVVRKPFTPARLIGAVRDALRPPR